MIPSNPHQPMAIVPWWCGMPARMVQASSTNTPLLTWHWCWVHWFCTQSEWWNQLMFFLDLFCPLMNDIEIIQNHPSCERILSANPPVWGWYSISILETETGMLWIDTVFPRLLLVLLQCFCSTSPQQTILLHEIPMIFLLKSHRWLDTNCCINPYQSFQWNPRFPEITELSGNGSVGKISFYAPGYFPSSKPSVPPIYTTTLRRSKEALEVRKLRKIHA